MNSDVVTANNYATDNDMLYGAHYVTLASDEISYENPTGTFVISHITPNSPGEAFNKVLPKNNTSNVINNDNLGTSRITTSNCITLTVPTHYFYITDLRIVTNTYGCGNGGLGGCAPVIIITRKKYYKGQRFVVANVGGNIDEMAVVGVK